MNRFEPASGASKSGVRRRSPVRRALAAFIILACAILAWPPAALAQAPSDDKLVLGGEYALADGEVLRGHLTILGGSATLARGSRVEQDVVIFGGELHVAGAVAGSLVIFGGSVTLADSATIENDLTVFGGALARSPRAAVRGQVFVSPDGPLAQTPWSLLLPEGFPPHVKAPRSLDAAKSLLLPLVRWQVGTLALALIMALLAAALVVFLPKQVGVVATLIAGRPLYSVGVGFLTLLLGLLAGSLLLIACGLGLLVWLALFAAMLFGWSAAGIWLGQRLFGLARIVAPSAIVEALIGVFLLTLLARLPFGVGILVRLAGVSAGLGAVVVTRFGRRSLMAIHT